MRYLLRILFFHLRRKKPMDWEPKHSILFFRLRDLKRSRALLSIVLLFFNYLTGKERIKQKRITALDYFLRKSLRKNAK